MTETKDNKTYKTRAGNNGESLIQIRAPVGTYFWRYVNEESGEIRFVPAK